MVRKTGQGEGFEAWRELLRRYEPRPRQTKVMRLLEVLSFEIKATNLVDSLERFDAAIIRYEREAAKPIDDEIEVGAVVRGLEKGSLREHLLLHSERCASYPDFGMSLRPSHAPKALA